MWDVDKKQIVTERGKGMKIDDIPEYRAMRTGLMALRLEVPPLVADDVLSLCEKAALAIQNTAYREGHKDGQEFAREESD